MFTKALKVVCTLLAITVVGGSLVAAGNTSCNSDTGICLFYMNNDDAPFTTQQAGVYWAAPVGGTHNCQPGNWFLLKPDLSVDSITIEFVGATFADVTLNGYTLSPLVDHSPQIDASWNFTTGTLNSVTLTTTAQVGGNNWWPNFGYVTVCSLHTTSTDTTNMINYGNPLRLHHIMGIADGS